MNGDDTNEPENLITAAIDAAEDICDPLAGLVERTATDPGAPFVSDILVRLAALRKDDRAAFEALRAQLKSAGARVTALDEAIAVKEAVCRGADTTHAPRGEVFTCDSITPNAHGEYSGFIVVHQDEHGDMSAVPGHHYENVEDAEAAAALEAKRIGARYVILGGRHENKIY